MEPPEINEQYYRTVWNLNRTDFLPRWSSIQPDAVLLETMQLLNLPKIDVTVFTDVFSIYKKLLLKDYENHDLHERVEQHVAIYIRARYGVGQR